MARVDYFAIEEAIRTQLKADTDTVKSHILIEPDAAQLPAGGDAIAIYLDRRDAPQELQNLAAGLRTRFLVTFSIWCFHFALMQKAEFEKRDDLVSQVELALMTDRTLSGAVDTSWLSGGEFFNSRTNDQDIFMLGAEVILTCQVTADA